MTTTRRDLIQALIQVQNHRAHNHHDIMTITGFMTDDEVRDHLESNIRQISKWAVRQ